MKKHISIILLSLCLTVGLLITVGLAADTPTTPTTGTCGENATWSYDQATKTLTISGSGAMADYGISSTDDRPWKRWKADGINKIEIKDGITAVGANAFNGCFGLRSITLPNSLTNIGAGAFIHCGFDSVLIPNSVTIIGTSSFANCANLVNITIQNGITSISDYMFSSCYNLSSVTIPDSVTSIGEEAFAGCTKLNNIVVPDGVTTIGRRAFHGCSSLNSIVIPDSIANIYPDALGECSSLAHIVLPASLTTVNYPGVTGLSGMLAYTRSPFLSSAGPKGSGKAIEFGWTETIPAGAFDGLSALSQVTLPDTVKTIGDNAFNGCVNLTQITLPNGVTTIGNGVFSGCASLKELNIPASVIRINNLIYSNAGNGCRSLESITVDPANTIYSSQDGALFNKEKTTLYCVPCRKSSFTIPSGVKTISNYAFSDCANLTELSIPNSVTEIGPTAFLHCAGLTELVIPDSVTSSHFNFEGCTALTELTYPGIHNYYVNSLPFDGPPNLTILRFSEGTVTLSGRFSNASTLTTVYLPSSLKAIGSSMFANCTNLKNIYFAGTQAQWNALTIADGNQELSLATVICTGTGETPPVDPDDPDTPTPPETLGVTTAPGGLGQRLTVQVQAGHWLTIQTRRAGSIAISSIQAPVGAGGVVTVTFSAPSGSVVQVWETENELTFVNGVPTNKILKTVVKEL